ncbi:Ig-like domain-containing protein [bacterium]|nr:Ig-like domain-containing protein [bacterium]
MKNQAKKYQLVNIFIWLIGLISLSSPLYSYTSLSVDAQGTSQEFYHLNQGLNQGFESPDPEFLEPVLNRLKDELGTKFIRIDHLYDKYVDVYYQNYEVKCNWERLDQYVKSIIDIGAQPLMCLSYMPLVLQSDQGAGISSPPKSYEDWQKLVKMTVQRYNKEKGYQIKYWEVWNEPENKSYNFWKGKAQPGESLDNLLKLYRYSLQGIEETEKEGSFKVKIGGFGLAGCTTHIIKKLLEENLRVDFVSWHHYGNLSGEKFNLKKLREEIIKIKEIVGSEKELIISEWNASVSGTSSGRMVNRSPLGASYAAAAISTMIENGVSLACFSQIRENYSASVWSLGMFYPNPEYTKPVFNVFKLYKMLESDKINLAGSLEQDITGGIATKSKNGENIKIIIWHRGKEKELINLSLENLNFDKVTVTRYLIDKENSNGRYYETDTSSPGLLNQEQELKIFKGPLIYQDEDVEFNHNSYNISFYLNPNSVTLFEIKGEVTPIKVVRVFPINDAKGKTGVVFNVGIRKISSFKLINKDNSSEVSGSFELKQKAITFTASTSLSYETNYQVEIKDLESLAGNKLEEYSYSFKLLSEEEPLSNQVEIFPSSLNKTHPLDFIQVKFNNVAIDELSLSSENIKLLLDQEELPTVFNYYQEKRLVNLFPEKSLFYKRDYQVILSSKVKDLQGNSLNKEHRFQTMSYPKIVCELSGKDGISPTAPLELYLKEEVLWGAAEDPVLRIEKTEAKNIIASFSLKGWKNKQTNYPVLEDRGWKCSFDTSQNKVKIISPNNLETNTLYYLTLIDKDVNWTSFSFTTSSTPLVTKDLIVEKRYPEGDKIDPTTEIYVIFNTDLDSSTINNQSIILYAWPAWPLPGGDIEGKVEYDSSKKKLSFIPSKLLTYKTTFKVTLNKDIKNIYGKSIGWEYTWTFTTKESNNNCPKISYRSPKPDEDNLSLGSKVVIEFDKNITQDVNQERFFVRSIDNQSLLSGIIEKELQRITFTPSPGTLKLGKNYEVFLSKEIGIEKDEVWKFTTKLLKISQITPQEREKIDLEDHLEVFLNEEISSQSKVIFTLQRDHQYLKGRTLSNNQEKKVIFIPEEKLTGATNYRASVVIKDGDIYLSRSWVFETKEGIMPLMFYPDQEEEDVSLNCDIGVKFNFNLDQEGVNKQNFILYGEIENKETPLEVTVAYLEKSKEALIKPIVNLAYANKYRVVIKKNIKSQEGVTLAKGYEWTFTTKNIPLMVMVNKKTSQEIKRIEGIKVESEDKILDEVIEKIKNFQDLSYKSMLHDTACLFNLNEVKYDPDSMSLNLTLPYQKEIKNCIPETKLSDLKIFYLEERDQTFHLIRGKQDLDPRRREIKAYPNQVHTYYIILENVKTNDLSLISVFPNPFHPLKDKQVTFINLPQEAMTIKLYTISGELIRTLDSPEELSFTRAIWDGKNEHGYLVASGIYIYVVKTEKGRKIDKIALIK